MRAKEFTINIPINIKINDDGDPEVTAGDEPIDDEVGEFVPPLQKKIELMKKQAGVESVYDDEEGAETSQDVEVDLTQLDDDEPLE